MGGARRAGSTLARGIVVGRGRDRLEEAATRLMTWQVHRDAGLRVQADSERVVPGARVVLRLRLGPLVVPAPCVVVGVVDEASAQGFTYATLPGHPEDGVEQFLLTLDADGLVQGVVHAVSRPASLLARLGGPVTGAVQRRQTDRYLQAMRARS